MKKIIIIAEIGINHNGNVDLAKKLILESKRCGADLVKFQKRDVKLVYDKFTLDQPRESPWGSTTLHQKEGLEFGYKEYDEINDYCKNQNIGWFASAWDLNSLDFLRKYNFKYNKIASAMIVDKKFIIEVAKQKKYTFISTGMSTIENIDEAVNIFKKQDCPFELMHCVSAYPFEDGKANLHLIKFLKERYNCDVGYSGHEKGGLAISYAASALGISSLERHITLDRTMYGSDQAASLTIKGFEQLVDGVRKIELAVNGKEKKRILEEEIEISKKLRAHIKFR